MVMAMVRPSAILMAIGGIMMRCNGSSMSSFVFYAARGLMTPFGLLMVLDTPVITGAGGGNADMRIDRSRVSDVTFLYQLNWVFLHFLGFFAFLGPAVLIETPVALHEVATGSWRAHSPEEHFLIEHFRLGLAILRAACGFLLLLAIPFMSTETKNPNTRKAIKWRAEFTVGEFGASQMYFSALSIWLSHGLGPYSWTDIVLLGVLFAEALRILTMHALFWLVVMHRWDSIDWSKEMQKRVPAQGPIMCGLRQVTRDELVFLHGVQAGVPDLTEAICKASPLGLLPANLLATGCKHSKVKWLIFKPETYSNFDAKDFCELAEEDQLNWNTDLSLALDTLPSADTLHFPYGAYKQDLNRPFVQLSCKEYIKDVQALGQDVVPNTEPATGEGDDVAYDITSKAIADPRTAFLLTKPLQTALKEGGSGATLAKFYDFVGTLLRDASAASPQAGGVADKSTPLLDSKVQMPEFPTYEIQIRGIQSSPPTVVFRAPSSQALPAGWENLERVDLMPECQK